MPTIEDYTDLILRVAGEPQGKAPNFDDLHTNQVVDVSWVRPNPLNARKSIVDVDAMADSIEHHGQLEAIAVTMGPDGFALIDSGHRRFLGKLSQLDRRMADGKTLAPEERTIKLHVVSAFEDPLPQAVRMLVYNLDRADLDPLDEAQEYRRLLESSQLTEGELAQRVGGVATEQRIRGRLNLLNLADGGSGPRVLQHYVDGRISTTAAEQIGRLPKDMQGEFARRVMIGDITGNDLQRAVSDALREMQIAQLQPSETFRSNGASSSSGAPARTPPPSAPAPRAVHTNGSAPPSSPSRSLNLTRLAMRSQTPTAVSAHSEKKKYAITIGGAKIVITVGKLMSDDSPGAVSKVSIDIAREDGGTIEDDSIAPLLVAFAGGNMPKKQALAFFERQVMKLREGVPA